MTENMRNALAGAGGRSYHPSRPEPATRHRNSNLAFIFIGITELTRPKGGLQTTSAAVGDVLGNSYDMRGGQSKKSDDAGKAIGDMGKGEFLHSLYLFSELRILDR